MKRTLLGSKRLHLAVVLMLLKLIAVATLHSRANAQSTSSRPDRIEESGEPMTGIQTVAISSYSSQPQLNTATESGRPSKPGLSVPMPPQTRDVDRIIQWLYSLSDRDFSNLLKSNHLGRLADAVTWALDKRNTDKKVAEAEIKNFVDALNARIRAVKSLRD